MIECLIIGDSIAVGIGMMRPDCVTEAKVGINSKDYLNSIHRKFHIPDSETTVISLGSNDGRMDTYDSLLAIRKEINAGKVIWVLSTNNKRSRLNVVRISTQFKDRVLDTSDHPMAKDKVHPTTKGYKALADSF